MERENAPNAKKIIIFASGEGSNAQNIINYFSGRNDVKIGYVLSNNFKANVLKVAHENEIDALHFDRTAMYNSNEVLHILQDAQPDLIVLAGFLWKIPDNIIEEFEGKIINIHPALLPKYGGKGMYGDHVHKAVLESEDKKTGISVHYVNSIYDDGKVINQFDVEITKNENLSSLKKKIKALEKEHFPKVIEQILFNEA